MEDLTGKQLGPYQIVSPLGEGGMAAVYKAYQPSMDRYVALKVLPRHFASDPEFVGRFSQEARVIANLQHPHILPVHDFGESDGYTYLAMRFIEGGTLSDWLKNNGPLSLERIRHIITQVGGALDYAHAQGVVHRDIKPGNILVDRWDNCLLTDFGLAKMVESSSHLTQTGGILGTPAYMSPEQGLGQEIDGRSDIYSLGVLLYQMAIGRLPYQAETPMAVVIKHIHDPLPPPSKFNPDLPELLELVILKALMKTPEDRFASAGDMVKALQSATEQPTIPRATAPTPSSEMETIPRETAVAPQTAVESETPSPPPTPPPTIIADEAEMTEPELALDEKRPLWKRPILYIGLAVVAIVVLGLLLIDGGGSEEPNGIADSVPQDAPQPQDAPPDERPSRDQPPLPPETIAQIAMAQDAHNAGDLERSFELYNEIIPQASDRADVHCQFGALLRDLDDLPFAADEFDQCRQLAKENQIADLEGNAIAMNALIQAEMTVRADYDNVDKALNFINEAMLHPNAPSWLVCERGEFYLFYDDEAAVSDFEVCLKENGHDPYWQTRAEAAINMIYGYGALDDEDYFTAVDHFKTWASLEPENPETQCALGYAHTGLGDYQAALGDFLRCRNIAGDDAEMQKTARSGELYAQAQSALEKNDLPKALEHYDEAIRTTPDDGWLFCERGQIHQELDHMREARHDYNQCLEMSNDDPVTHDWAEELLDSLNDSN